MAWDLHVVMGKVVLMAMTRERVISGMGFACGDGKEHGEGNGEGDMWHQGRLGAKTRVGSTPDFQSNENESPTKLFCLPFCLLIYLPLCQSFCLSAYLSACLVFPFSLFS